MMMSIMLSARNKDCKVLNSPLSMKMVKTANGVIIPSKDYLLDLYNSNSGMIGLVSNANFGHLPTGEDSQIMMAAGAWVDMDIQISDQEFHFKKHEDVFYRDIKLLDLLGKEHKMSITTPEGTENYKFYIPESIIAQQLKPSTINTNIIQRSGNVLHWNPDSQYPTKVVFEYQLYDKEPAFGELLYRDVVVVDDIGQLDLDKFLANKDAKGFRFSIYRVNAIEVNTDGQKVALAFVMVDHHSYRIQD